MHLDDANKVGQVFNLPIVMNRNLKSCATLRAAERIVAALFILIACSIQNLAALGVSAEVVVSVADQ